MEDEDCVVVGIEAGGCVAVAMCSLRILRTYCFSALVKKEGRRPSLPPYFKGRCVPPGGAFVHACVCKKEGSVRRGRADGMVVLMVGLMAWSC